MELNKCLIYLNIILKETSTFRISFIFVLIHMDLGVRVRDVSINVRVTRTLRHVVFPANQNPSVAVLTNQRPGEVLTHLIVTENCIWLFLRQKVSCQTSSLCCHYHCGIPQWASLAIWRHPLLP